MTIEARKTPFYKIAISDSKGQKFVELPYQLQRLVEKVEIKEMFGTGWCTPGQFTISFMEGSREPYPNSNEINTSQSYPIDSTGAGSLTNTTGMLADLRYVNSGGEETITSIPVGVTGIILDNLGSGDLEEALGSVLEKASGISPQLITLDGKITSNQPVKYLFQQRNKIKITWGYLEDNATRRTVIGSIAGIEIEYPDADQVKLKVISVDTALHFDQVSGIFGARFFTSAVSGTSKTGKPLVTFKNLSVKKLIEKFSKDAGMGTPMVSDEFDDVSLDKYAFNVIPAGFSPNQYFGELAKKYDAYYRVYVDPTTGQDTIVFLAKGEYNSKPLSDDKNMFTYRAPGSIIKTVQLKAEYGALAGSAAGGVNEAGKQVAIATKAPVTIGMVDADSQYTDSDPTGNNPVTAAKGAVTSLNTPFAVGTHHYTPEANDVKTVSRQAEAKSECQIEKTIIINLSTIGYAPLRPGPWYIGGLGSRFTGTYYLNEVTHTLDAGGYVCSAMGGNHSDYGNTGKNANNTKQTQKVEQAINVGLVKVDSTATGGTASDTYNSKQKAGN